MTCGFDRSPKISLTDWLAFWLAGLCDVDHMESRGVWCRTALSSVQAVDLGALPGADAHSVNQASTKAACYQQVSAGAAMAMLRHAGKVAARLSPAVLVPTGPARARRPGVPVPVARIAC